MGFFLVRTLNRRPHTNSFHQSIRLGENPSKLSLDLLDISHIVWNLSAMHFVSRWSEEPLRPPQIPGRQVRNYRARDPGMRPRAGSGRQRRQR
ncbi:hypothetical protein PSAB6_180084 [Paraburkholderia sabiae]|nr:hypothetical protein PSAB6_180084 [Paraburkholderia sabiae]